MRPSDRKVEIKWAGGDEDFSSELVAEESVRFVKEFVPLQLAQAKCKADILVVDRLEDSSAPSLWLASIVQLEHSLLKTRKPSVAVRYRNRLWPETWVPLHACYQLIPRRNRLAATREKFEPLLNADGESTDSVGLNSLDAIRLGDADQTLCLYSNLDEDDFHNDA